MQKKVLGRGLAALIPERGAPAEKAHDLLEPSEKTKPEEIVYLKVEEIRPSRYQPRADFDQEKLAELVASIKEKGVVQPVLVRPSPGDPGGPGRYELIVGERRLRAAKSLGMEEVPTIIREVEDIEAFELSLVENLQREDLNLIEEAYAYQRLMAEFGFTQEEIARIIGKDRASVANTIRLLKLPKEIQEWIKIGKLSAGHGRAILGIEGNEEQLRLCERIISKELSVRSTEELVRRKKLPAGPKKEERIKRDPHLTTAEEELQHVLGTRVRIISLGLRPSTELGRMSPGRSRRKRKGRIEIEYYSEEELERILIILRKA